MKILKFGGTSVGSAESIKQVVKIIHETQGRKIVVFSAFSGVTNLLVSMDDRLSRKKDIANILNQLYARCHDVIDNLFSSKKYEQRASLFLNATIEEIQLRSQQSYTQEMEMFLLAQGELISSQIIQFYLEEQLVESSLISALDFMRTNENKEPDYILIEGLIRPILDQNDSNLIITQGFICKNFRGQVANLERGGSDYTASIVGSVLEAEEIQIWTDITGMHNNDPRYVKNTFSVEEVSFDEAAELAYFGAKILHPQSLIPAKEKDIPVLLKNTFAPEEKGTVIKKDSLSEGVTSIAAKDGITAIKIKSYRMLMAYGFLKKIFEVFETYKTPIDMITTSEVAVSLTIDNHHSLQEIINELKDFGSVEVDTHLSIVCIAGNFSQEKEGLSAKIFNALSTIPIRMISYGGSNYNTSILVKTSHKIATLNALNKELFKDRLPLV